MKFLTAKETNYIFPPRAKLVVPRSEINTYKAIGWLAQLKYNGSRCLIKYTSTGTVELWNRHGERFRNYHAPDFLIDQLQVVRTRLGLDPNSWSLLDGELLDFKHPAIKDTIAIWDTLVVNGQHLIGTKYFNRYKEQLAPISSEESWMYKNYDFGTKVSDNILIPRSYFDGWDGLWDMIHEVNKPFTVGNEIKPLLEGLVLKAPDGELEMGYKEQNNGSWMIRSRVKTGRHSF